MRMKKMRTPDLPSKWPNGVRCVHCSRMIVPKDSVLVGHQPTQGTLAFHKGCIVGLVKKEWPSSQYDEIRQDLIENHQKYLLEGATT